MLLDLKKMFFLLGIGKKAYIIYFCMALFAVKLMTILKKGTYDPCKLLDHHVYFIYSKCGRYHTTKYLTLGEPQSIRCVFDFLIGQ